MSFALCRGVMGPMGRVWYRLVFYYLRFILPSYCLFVYLFFLFKSERVGEGQRETERESEADSALSAEPNAGLNLKTLRSWPEQNQMSDT